MYLGNLLRHSLRWSRAAAVLHEMSLAGRPSAEEMERLKQLVNRRFRGRRLKRRTRWSVCIEAGAPRARRRATTAARRGGRHGSQREASRQSSNGSYGAVRVGASAELVPCGTNEMKTAVPRRDWRHRAMGPPFSERAEPHIGSFCRNRASALHREAVQEVRSTYAGYGKR